MPNRNRTRKISVFEGHALLPQPPNLSRHQAAYWFYSDTNEHLVPLSTDLLSKHILFLGGIGTGKTNAIFQLVGQLRKHMTPADVMIIFDTKGDYYNAFYNAGDIVISNDRRLATGPDGPDYWNIFNEIPRDRSMDETISEIARALFYEKTSQSNQPFFPNAARDIFTGIMLGFCRNIKYQNANNAMLRNFLDSASTEEIREWLNQYIDLRAMTNYIKNESNQTQGVISELQQLVREVFVSSFAEAGTLSLRKAVREKSARAIFIEYDLSIGNLLAPIYRLLIDMAIKEALGRKKSEGNVWFIIDEFRLIPHLQHVDNGVNFGRSLGAKFVIGVQNVQQVFDAYGEDLARSILSGFMTTVAFRVNDYTTRTFIQQLCGRNRKLDVYTMNRGGITENLHEANVVEDWDIDSMGLGDAIIRLPSHQPFKFHFGRFRPDA